MGIKGLLPILQSITKPVKLEDYCGLVAAVDAMSLLHRGIFCDDVKMIAKEQYSDLMRKYQQPDDKNSLLYKNRDKVAKRLNFDDCVDDDTRNKQNNNRYMSSMDSDFRLLAHQNESKCVDYVLKKVQILQTKFGIEVLLVIDGAPLPSKAKTDQRRRGDRIKAFHSALDAERRGDQRGARRFFAQSCSISYKMRYELIKNCKQLKIRYIVAPYEADAQMAYFALNSVVDFVITEDSDMLVYGCPRVLFKIDLDSGRASEIQLMRDLARNGTLDFKQWTHDMFVYMCILAGCDYCQGIPGIGIKTAHKLVRMNRTPKKILEALKLAGTFPKEFEVDFFIAYRTFRYARIYSLESNAMDTLHPLNPCEMLPDQRDSFWDFLGPWRNSSMSTEIANGNLHPKDLSPWVTIDTYNEANHHQNASQKNDEAPNMNINTYARKKSVSKREVFGFRFSKIPNERKDVIPLTEIYIHPNLPAISNKIKPKTIPIRSSDYVSNLVGASFQTLNRNVKKKVSTGLSSLQARLKADHETFNSTGTAPVTLTRHKQKYGETIFRNNDEKKIATSYHSTLNHDDAVDMSIELPPNTTNSCIHELKSESIVVKDTYSQRYIDIQPDMLNWYEGSGRTESAFVDHFDSLYLEGIRTHSPSQARFDDIYLNSIDRPSIDINERRMSINADSGNPCDEWSKETGNGGRHQSQTGFIQSYNKVIDANSTSILNFDRQCKRESDANVDTCTEAPYTSHSMRYEIKKFQTENATLDFDDRSDDELDQIVNGNLKVSSRNDSGIHRLDDEIMEDLEAFMNL